MQNTLRRAMDFLDNLAWVALIWVAVLVVLTATLAVAGLLPEPAVRYEYAIFALLTGLTLFAAVCIAIHIVREIVAWFRTGRA